MFEPTLSVPELSMPRRFDEPVSPNVIVPLPDRFCTPPSKTIVLLALMATVPLSVRPFVIRSLPVLVARFRLPLSVTPLR